MIRYLSCIALLTISSELSSNELEWLSWTEIRASARDIVVDAKLNKDSNFKYLYISTPFGKFSLSEDEKLKITKPNLKSFQPVIFPVSSRAQDVEYHLQFNYLGNDFDHRQHSCRGISGVQEEDYVRIKLRKDSAHELKIFEGSCNSVLP